jgi:hypothetical protein
VNISVTTINIESNQIGTEAAVVLDDALQVNTSLTRIGLVNNPIDESNRASVDALLARNRRFRCMFLYDARRMLLSLICTDECGVVWPYLLERGDTDGVAAPDNLESIRAEFEGVVAERRRCLHGAPEAKRRLVE